MQKLLQVLICTLIPFNLEMEHRLLFWFFKRRGQQEIDFEEEKQENGRLQYFHGYG